MARPQANPGKAQSRATAKSVDRSLILLACILAAAALPRLMTLDEAFPAQDELWSLELSTGRGSAHLALPVNEFFHAMPMTQLGDDAPPWYAVWTSLDRVTHPPLYFLALRGWRAMFGDGDVAARSLSIAASLLAIVLLYDATRLLTRSRATALWSAALMAVAAPQIEHARLVRNYALLLMLGVLAWWAIARLCDAPARGRAAAGYSVLLAVSVAMMLLTHYFAAGAVGALLAYAFTGLTGTVRRKAAIAIVVGAVVWLAAWGPMLRRHVNHFSGADTTTDFLRRKGATGTGARMFQTFIDAVGAPTRLIVDLPQRPLPLAAIGGIACATLVVAAWRGRRGELLLPILWIAGTVGSVALLDLFRSTIHLQAVRYTLLASPGLFVLLGAGIPSRRAALLWRHALPAALVLLCAIEFARSISRLPPFDWRPLATFLDESSRAGEPIVFTRDGQPDWYVGHQVMAYRHASRLPPEAREILILQAPAPPAVLARLRHWPRSWVFHMTGRPYDARESLPGFSVTTADVPDFLPVVGEAHPE